MKQKVVISVSFNGSKNSQSKALQIAAGFSGVDSAAIEGEDENQIVVTGINIDMVELVKKLKKKVGFSTILTATVIDGDKKDKDKDDDGDEELKVWPNFHVRVPPYYTYDVPAYPSNNCTIL